MAEKESLCGWAIEERHGLFFAENQLDKEAWVTVKKGDRSDVFFSGHAHLPTRVIERLQQLADPSPRPAELPVAETDAIAEEVARMVHAFSDEDRKEAVRELAKRIRALTPSKAEPAAERARFVTWFDSLPAEQRAEVWWECEAMTAEELREHTKKLERRVQEQEAELLRLKSPAAAEPAEGRWVRAAERLPEEGIRVLFWHRDWPHNADPGVGVFRRDDEFGDWWEDTTDTDQAGDGETYYSGVTHWQPMPKCPPGVRLPPAPDGSKGEG